MDCFSEIIKFIDAQTNVIALKMHYSEVNKCCNGMYSNLAKMNLSLKLTFRGLWWGRRTVFGWPLVALSRSCSRSPAMLIQSTTFLWRLFRKVRLFYWNYYNLENGLAFLEFSPQWKMMKLIPARSPCSGEVRREELERGWLRREESSEVRESTEEKNRK